MNAEKDDIKRLYRSKEDKMIAGVCGGLAEYLNVDPVWVRLVMVILLFAQGIGLIIYIVAWILIPENPNQRSTRKTAAERTVSRVSKKERKVVSEKRVQRKPRHHGDGSAILGLIVILIGAYLLFKNIFVWLNFSYIWPVALIVIVLYMLVQRGRK